VLVHNKCACVCVLSVLGCVLCVYYLCVGGLYVCVCYVFVSVYACEGVHESERGRSRR